MKLMNTIESEVDGEIVKVLVKDGEMVEYGQPIFKVKTV
jgi:acetyl-CoA carboxylase biotin carboxyl carrier protein